jgi:hypothetical protein
LKDNNDGTVGRTPSSIFDEHGAAAKVNHWKELFILGIVALQLLGKGMGMNG